LTLANGRQMTGQSRRLAGFDERGGAEIDRAGDMGKNAYTATTVAHSKPMTTIFKWVARSALYIEWFITSSRFCICRSKRAEGFD